MITDEQIEQMAENPEQAEQYLQSQMIGASSHIKNYCSGLQDKYNDLKTLGDMMVKLQQLFIDLGTLVQQQGQMLDNIEINVIAANENVHKGEQEVIKAQEY